MFIRTAVLSPALLPRATNTYLWRASGPLVVHIRDVGISAIKRAPTTHIRHFTASTIKRAAEDRFSSSDDELIIKLRKEGQAWPKIAALLGRTARAPYHRYQNYLRYRGDDPHTRRLGEDPLTTARNQEILQWVDNDGLSFAEIGRRLGCSRHFVRRQYDSVCTVQKRSTGNGCAIWSQFEKEAIASGLRLGKSEEQIAEGLGSNRSSQAVERVIRMSEELRKLRPNKKRRYTLEEDRAIEAMTNSKSISLTQLAKQLDRQPSSLYNRAELLKDKARREKILSESASVPDHDDLQSSNSDEKTLGLRNSSPSMDNDGIFASGQKKHLRRAYVVKRKRSNGWTPEEDDRLISALPAGAKADWDVVARQFTGRSANAIRKRSHHLRAGPAFSRNGYVPRASAERPVA